MAEGQRRRLQQRERPSRRGTTSCGEHDAEATVGVAHEVSALVHQRSDVVRVAQEVLTLGRRAVPVPAPVDDEQAEALLGERMLCFPLLFAGGQRAVDEHDRRPASLHVDGQLAHVDASLRVHDGQLTLGQGRPGQCRPQVGHACLPVAIPTARVMPAMRKG